MKLFTRTQIALFVFELVTLPLAVAQLGLQILGLAACLITDAILAVLDIGGRVFSIPLTWYVLGLYAWSQSLMGFRWW